MRKTKLWAVSHTRCKETMNIVVTVRPYTEEYSRDGAMLYPHRLFSVMKFRTITPRAAARRYIRNNLFGIIAEQDGCPCCDPDWTDDYDRKSLNGRLSDAREKYNVEIRVEKNV